MIDPTWLGKKPKLICNPVNLRYNTGQKSIDNFLYIFFGQNEVVLNFFLIWVNLGWPFQGVT
jgi:hypothetical protein